MPVEAVSPPAVIRELCEELVAKADPTSVAVQIAAAYLRDVPRPAVLPGATPTGIPAAAPSEVTVPTVIRTDGDRPHPRAGEIGRPPFNVPRYTAQEATMGTRVRRPTPIEHVAPHTPLRSLTVGGVSVPTAALADLRDRPSFVTHVADDDAEVEISHDGVPEATDDGDDSLTTPIPTGAYRDSRLRPTICLPLNADPSRPVGK